MMDFLTKFQHLVSIYHYFSLMGSHLELLFMKILIASKISSSLLNKQIETCTPMIRWARLSKMFSWITSLSPLSLQLQPMQTNSRLPKKQPGSGYLSFCQLIKFQFSRKAFILQISSKEDSVTAIFWELWVRLQKTHRWLKGFSTSRTISKMGCYVFGSVIMESGYRFWLTTVFQSTKLRINHVSVILQDPKSGHSY